MVCPRGESGIRGSPGLPARNYGGRGGTIRPARGVSSAGRAPPLQGGGHRFDPDTLHSRAGRGRELLKAVIVSGGCASSDWRGAELAGLTQSAGETSSHRHAGWSCDGRPRPVAEITFRSPGGDMTRARATIRRTPRGLATVRCECGDPACRATVPAVAATHRGLSGRIVMTPSHLNGGTVVRAADEFFVVQPDRRTLQRARKGLE